MVNKALSVLILEPSESYFLCILLLRMNRELQLMIVTNKALLRWEEERPKSV